MLVINSIIKKRIYSQITGKNALPKSCGLGTAVKYYIRPK